MKEYDVILATRPLHDGRVTLGETGVILDIYTDPLEYLVEFPDNTEDDFVVFSCAPGDIALKYEFPLPQPAQPLRKAI